MTYEYDNERKGFVMRAVQDVAVGEPVYESYGVKCNSRFFLHYGFIYQNNDANEAPIEIKLNADDPLYDTKVGIIGTP